MMIARSRALATILVKEGSIAESEALIKNKLQKDLVKGELEWLASLSTERTQSDTELLIDVMQALPVDMT